MTEMLVAKLPDPPSEDPNEDDVKDEEILRKLSKLKKFNKKWLDNENSAPVEEKVRVADNVLKEVAACQIVKRILKMLEVMYKLICLVLNSLMPKILSLKACLTSLGCWRWQTTRLSYWRLCPSALDNFMSVLCSVNMDLVVAVEVDETASADKHYGVRPCVMPRLFPR